MWQAIIDAVKFLWDWICGLMQSFAGGVVSAIMSFFPDSVQGSLNSNSSSLGFALSAANAWAPLDYAITLGALYIVFVLSVFAVRVLVKLIRG